MDISIVSGLAPSALSGTFQHAAKAKDNGFASMLDSAMNMVNETNDLQNKAESAEMQFALGLMDNTHDLQIAQEKANIALQYTVAVRDKLIEGYKEIMNMQV